jgi:hypothetical protein
MNMEFTKTCLLYEIIHGNVYDYAKRPTALVQVFYNICEICAKMLKY